LTTQIRPALFRDVSGYVKASASEGVAIEDRADTQWFTIDADGRPVGCVGLRRRSARRVSVVGVYVAPFARGYGVGSAATEQVIALAAPGVTVDAVAYNPKWYLARGFVVGRTYLHGSLVRREAQ